CGSASPDVTRSSNCTSSAASPSTPRPRRCIWNLPTTAASSNSPASNGNPTAASGTSSTTASCTPWPRAQPPTTTPAASCSSTATPPPHSTNPPATAKSTSPGSTTSTCGN